MKQGRRRGWLAAGAALALAGWLFFWYFPRPLADGNQPWDVFQVELWSGKERMDMTGQVDIQALLIELEKCKVHPAFSSDYFPYQLENAPLSIRFLDSRERPWEVIAGPDWAVASSGREIVWPIAGGKELWPELSALLPGGLLQGT